MKKRVDLILFMGLLFADNDMCGFGPPEAPPSETGNWYEKLQWWHKAKPMSDKIADRADDCIEYKQELAEKAAKGFPRISELYVDLAIGAEEILKKIETHEALLSQQKDEAENAGEEDELARIKRNEATLDELKNNIDLLTLIANRLEEVVRQTTRIEQTVESYEVQALRVYKRISGEADEVFDDQEAHKLYKQLQNYYENIDSLAAHLDGPLRMYVGSMLARINSVSTSVRSLVQVLEGQEIPIKPVVETQEPEEKPEETKEAAAQDVEKEQPKKGLFRRITDYFGSFF